jgi:hypothetical protein
MKAFRILSWCITLLLLIILLFPQALKILPTKSLSCKEIARRSCLSLEEFICDYFLRETPVIISGCIDHWPAMTKWKDIQYLKKIAGDRTVPVEVNASPHSRCRNAKQAVSTLIIYDA